MKPGTLITLSAAIEAATGLALMAGPGLVANVLLGAGLSDSGVAVARVAGCGLLSLGIACWPSGDSAAPAAIRALFVYNLLVGLYLGYLRVAGGFAGLLLWPACILHILLALLMARRAFESVRSK